MIFDQVWEPTSRKGHIFIMLATCEWLDGLNVLFVTITIKLKKEEAEAGRSWHAVRREPEPTGSCSTAARLKHLPCIVC